MKAAADPESLPACSAVAALEDFVRGRRQNAGAAIHEDPDIVNVGIRNAGADALPAVAAIDAAADSVHLDPGPDDAVIARIDAERRDPRDTDIRAFLGHLSRQLLPATPAVFGAEQRRWAGSGEDRIGLDGIDRDLPDMQFVHRRCEAIECLSAVAAPINP